MCSACSRREESRVTSRAALVVFGNVELLDFSKGRVVLRPRVTCYSKHHGESVGFLYDFSVAHVQAESLTLFTGSSSS